MGALPLSSVKLEDIANQLGLSISTVSRALSGNGRIGKETRERVLAEVHKSDYTVNAVARSLRLKNARNIGIIVPDITNSFFASVIKSAQHVCRSNGYTLMVCNSDESAEYETESLHSLLEKQISGLILSSVCSSDELMRHYESLNTPVVFIDNVPNECDKCNVVSIDNYAAARQITQALIDRGYTCIGMISGPRSQSTGLLRYNGFCDAISAANLPLRAEWIAEGDFKMESGYTCMKALLALERRPRAMIFANNYIAYGAINAIRDCGLRIPSDIAVASFDAVDDTHLITPLITSINQPADQIGKCAAEILFRRFASETKELCENIVLQPSFINGQSW